MPTNQKKPFSPKIDPTYMPNATQEVLDKNLADLNIYPETVAKLQSVGLNTVFDVARIEMKYIYRIDTVTRKDVFALLRALHSLGLDFKPNPNKPVQEDGAEKTAESPKQGQQRPNNRPNQAPNGQNQAANPRQPQDRNNPPKQGQPRPNNRPNQAPNGQNQAANPRQPQDRNNNPRRDTRQNNGDGQSRDSQRQNNGRDRVNSRDNTNNNGREKINSRDFERDGFKFNSNNSSNKNNNSNNNSNNKQRRNAPEDTSIYCIANSTKRKPPINTANIKLPPQVIADGLYKFYAGGKWGYKDDKGAVVIEPQFDEAYNFSEGMAGIELHERVGFINTSGEVVVPAEYDTACSFTEGLASVTKDNKCGYIDKTGELVFPMEYDSATPFKDGSALIKKEGKWCFICKETGEIRPR